MTDATTNDNQPEEPVLVTTSNGVATVTLNRPGAMNALDVPAKVALRDAVQRLAADADVRCVVLTGTGRAFCVGQDLKEHIALLAEGREDVLDATVAEHYNPTVLALATMPKPVIAAVNGVAAGAGASLAFACDYRVVADTAGFNLAFTGIALSCDTGASWTLPRLVGRAKALELLLQPRTVSAQESLELGIASRVVAADALADEAAALAAQLAAGPTLAYAAVRDAVDFSASHGFAESLANEGRLMALTGATEDHRQAVASFVAKQKPVFHGR